MRATIGIALALLTVLFAGLASAEPLAYVIERSVIDPSQIDAVCVVPSCWPTCDPGPVAVWCNHDTPGHGRAACLVFVTFTSTCINPLPQGS